MYTSQLSTAGQKIIGLADRTTEDQLDRPTPCDPMDLAALFAHVIGLSIAFAAAGRKETGPLTSTPPDPNIQVLQPDWRESLKVEVGELVAAWADPDAWEGMTQAGGVSAPASILGTVAVSELVLHGWDIARAIGVDYDLDDNLLRVVYDLHYPPQPQSERDGMFGPLVEVPDDAPLLHRLVGLAGRDPFWPTESVA
ncbi:TIGR03086 family metal-binding protein [Gordonia sp. CPCC 205333]|uniref:TIGR03086 family metal-binding protein n=1 Tax=Gordonia sp. CPCC 205333 TaxID=3140790 RepID=UPI003AF3E327